MFTRLFEALRYISEAFVEIFSPTDDYPTIGVQPFDGEPYSRWV